MKTLQTAFRVASRGLKTSARLSDVPIGNAATAKNGVIPTSAGYKKFNALQLKLMADDGKFVYEKRPYDYAYLKFVQLLTLGAVGCSATAFYHLVFDLLVEILYSK